MNEQNLSSLQIVKNYLGAGGFAGLYNTKKTAAAVWTFLETVSPKMATNPRAVTV